MGGLQGGRRERGCRLLRHLGVPERPSWGCPRLGSGAQVPACGGEGSFRPCVSLQILKSSPCPLWAGGKASRGLSLSRPAQGWLRGVPEGIKWAARLQGSESQRVLSQGWADSRCCSQGVSPLFVPQEMRLREVELPARGHTASKQGARFDLEAAPGLMSLPPSH